MYSSSYKALWNPMSYLNLYVLSIFIHKWDQVMLWMLYVCYLSNVLVLIRWAFRALLYIVNGLCQKVKCFMYNVIGWVLIAEYM